MNHSQHVYKRRESDLVSGAISCKQNSFSNLPLGLRSILKSAAYEGERPWWWCFGKSNYLGDVWQMVP